MTARAPVRGNVRGAVRRTPWPHSASTAVVTPLQPSVVYSTEGPAALDRIYAGEAAGYSYAREGHPNADVVAAKIDALEGIDGGLVVGSGMAAVTAALMGVLKAGDHVLAATQLYGRSLRLLDNDLPRFGIATSRADATDGDAFAAAMRPETRMILVEAVSNPMLRVADMDALRRIATERGALLVLDNTFTTPACLRGSDVGADIVIHSVTKLLAGHSDVTLGYVAARDPELRRAMVDFATSAGLTPSPFDCWLAERGLQSFELRFARAQANAAALADAVAGHGAVARVLYPGRPDHPDHARAAALLGVNFGTMVTFELGGGRDAVERFAAAAPGFAFAPTLGDVATTLSHPASSSHRALTSEARAALGISEGTLRVSLGIEPTEEVIDGLAAALAAV
jgi:cystathionine gamma-synthase